MEKTHQAAAEEDNQAKALEAFFTRKDATQGPLLERFEKVKEKHQVLTKLFTESAEIAKPGNIISFEKRAANKDNEASELSKEQKDSLMSELLNQKILLNDNCGIVN